MIKYIEKLKGASDQDINMWEVFFSQEMPRDYREFIRKSDGPRLQNDEINCEFHFLSLQQTIACFRNIIKEYCHDAIPICKDSKGNFAVYRIENSVISGIYVMAEEINWDCSKEVGKSIQDLLQINIDDEILKKE